MKWNIKWNKNRQKYRIGNRIKKNTNGIKIE